MATPSCYTHTHTQSACMWVGERTDQNWKTTNTLNQKCAHAVLWMTLIGWEAFEITMATPEGSLTCPVYQTFDWHFCRRTGWPLLHWISAPTFNRAPRPGTHQPQHRSHEIIPGVIAHMTHGAAGSFFSWFPECRLCLQQHQLFLASLGKLSATLCVFIERIK